MYEILNEAHRGSAILAVVLTLGWLTIVLFAPRGRPVQLTRPQRLVYVGAMALTGVAGITGLAVMAIGQWLAMVFPWAGLVAVAGHGIAGARSRRALVAGNKGPALVGVALQIAFLVIAYGLMTVKPF